MIHSSISKKLIFISHWTISWHHNCRYEHIVYVVDISYMYGQHQRPSFEMLGLWKCFQGYVNTSNYIQNDTFKSNNDHILLPTMTYTNLFGFREWQRESFIPNFLRKHVKDKVTIHFLRCMAIEWLWYYDSI